MYMSVERRNQGLGVWFRDEIQDTLNAVDAANWDIAQHLEGTDEIKLYRKGFEAALRAVAAAFGLSYSPQSHTAARRDTPARLLQLQNQPF